MARDKVSAWVVQQYKDADNRNGSNEQAQEKDYKAIADCGRRMASKEGK